MEAESAGAAEDQNRRDTAGELRDAGRVIREQFWLIAACALIGLAAGVAYGKVEDPQYQSTAKVLLLQPDPNASALDSPLVSEDPARGRATDIELARSEPVAQKAAEQLGNGQSAGELIGKVSTSTQGDSNVLSITATSTESAETSPIANAFARAFIEFKRETTYRNFKRALDRVNRQIKQLSQDESSETEQAAQLRRLRNQADYIRLLVSLQIGNAQLIETAAGPGYESGSGGSTAVLVGGLLGLMIGLGAGFLRDRLDPRVKSEAQVRALLGGIPVIGRIPRITRKSETRRAALERFHLLCSELEALGVSSGGSSLLVTSAMRGEGKSSIAASLAVAVSQRGEAAILVEADVRNPELSRYTGVSSPGLTDVLRGQSDIDSTLHRAAIVESEKGKGPQIPGTNLVPFIPAGTVGEDHWKLFKEEPLRNFLDQLAPHSSLVVIDGPPLGMFSDMAVLGRLVDKMILVVQMGESRTQALARLREQLEVAAVKPAGIVLVGASLEIDDYRRDAG